MDINTELVIKDGRLERYYGGDCDVVIPEGVEYIMYNAFYNCKEIRSVKIPSSVESIGYFAFWGCTSLQRVDIADGLRRIQLCAFKGCKNLRRAVLPNSVRYLEKDVFLECDGLKSLICSPELRDSLDGKLAEISIFELSRRLKENKLSDEEKNIWAEAVEENAELCFELMKDDAEFFHFALSRCAISEETVKNILENSGSLECRALLIEYLMKRNNG